MDIFLIAVMCFVIITFILVCYWFDCQIEELRKENKQIKKFYIDTSKQIDELDYMLQKMPSKLRLQLAVFLKRLAEAMKENE